MPAVARFKHVTMLQRRAHRCVRRWHADPSLCHPQLSHFDDLPCTDVTERKTDMRKFLVISAAVLMAATAVDPALAQGRGRGNNPVYSNGYEDGYRDAYRDAYRTGYGDARANRRFDDTDYSYGYGHSNGPNNNFSNNKNYGNNNF